jgi:hypothetical protein
MAQLLFCLSVYRDNILTSNGYIHVELKFYIGHETPKKEKSEAGQHENVFISDVACES